MKSYILFAILIGLGTSQIVVTSQNICGCTQLTNTIDCGTLPGCTWTNDQCQISCSTQTTQSACLKASYYCQWNKSANPPCQTFQLCENLTATNSQQCYEQNARCLGYGILPNSQTSQCLYYHQITSSCIDYPQTTCSLNFGKDGPCYWMNDTCQVINQCSYAQKPTQCEQLNLYKQQDTAPSQGVVCQWVGDQTDGQCQAITNCNQFTSEDTCKHYFSNLSSITLNVCVWSTPAIGQPSCVPVTKLSQLNQDNCLKNTGLLFRWYGSQNNPNYGICGPCKQATQQITKTYNSRTQCTCSDYIYVSDCNSQGTLCQWNNATNTCSANPCTNIQAQNICTTVTGCYWSFSNDSCLTLNNCTDLTFRSSSVGCAAQSLQCAGFDGGNCVATSSIKVSCNKQTNQQSCSQYISSEGLCVWSNNGKSCSLLQNCNQITDAIVCGSWQNQCVWDAGTTTCQQQTCSTITDKAKCTFVMTQFQQTEYQLCRWNLSQGTNGACENAYSALLQTSTTCVSNTGNTFRWSTNNQTSGMCITCSANKLQLQTPSSCQCSQLNSKDNCQNSGFCSYNSLTNTCSPSPCTQYENQITCAALSTCYWAGTKGCLAFTNCSSLPQVNNQLECVNMNVSCQGISNGTCQSFPTQTCAAMYTANPANPTCYNNIGTDGICFLSKNGQTNQCTGFSQCSQAPNGTFCLRNQLSCSWDTTLNKCSQINCSSFQTQQNCKFYLPNPLSSQVVPCLWNTTQNKCEPASDILTQLQQSNCASNTYNTYAWVAVQNNTKNGYCIRCQEQITLPKQCHCSYLSQYDCSQALECYWNNGQCTKMNCSQILQSTVCASQTNCQWNNQNNSCSDLVGSCASLKGTTQAQCMAQNVYCVGSNGGICSSSYSKCETNTQDTACVATLGSDGACFWNNTTSQCQAANTCTQLPGTACKLKNRSCYWDGTTCQTLSCSTLYSQFGQCTFVMNVLSLSYVQSCQMVNNQCVEIPDPSSLTQDQCFTNTNRTARWVPKTKGEGGICYSCSANMIPIYSAQTCSCYQYMTQNDCYGAPAQSCAWVNGICTEMTCTNIISNQACAQTIGCGWNSTTKACQTFTQCSQAPGITTTSTVQDCLSYSTQCKGFNGTACTQFPQQACGSLTSPNSCSGNTGTDGVCFWIEASEAVAATCIAITSCTEITNKQICSYYQNICTYSNQQCSQLTCANFTSPASCRYVVTNFITGEVQQCQWSTTSSTCGNLITPAQLNSVNCSANTGFTYRWVPAKNQNGQGYCTKCVINSFYVPGQCACNQLIYQNDCQANPQCAWSATQNTPSCYNKPCNLILQQALCSSNPRCSWSAAQQVCQPFSSCSDLAGVNAGECASYSIFCAAISTTLLPIQQKYICSPTASQQCSVNTPSATGGTTTESDCLNTYVPYGICQYNQTTKQCVKITQCSQITSPQQCQRFVHSCVWQLSTGETTTGSCVATSCSNITNKLECTYVLSSLATPSASSVTQCQWQPTNGCVKAPNVLTTLTSGNCYANTLMMSRWTSTSPNSGYCATCSQYSVTATLKSPCSCSVLSQYECNTASPQCSYNATSSKCTTQTCTAIQSQYSCSANPNCIYIGSCQKYTSSPSSTTYGCANITTATNAFECYTASVNCPQFIPSTTNGQAGTCGAAQSCSKFNNQAACTTYNSQVATSYCVWNNGSCQTINNCKQITDVALCSLQTNRCQWSVLFNSCFTQSCSSYTSQADCTYVYTSYSPGDVALCYWDSTYNDCRSASLSYAETFNTTNSTTCFVNTGHVYHLDGNDCIKCFQNILSILLIAVLLILI